MARDDQYEIAGSEVHVVIRIAVATASCGDEGAAVEGESGLDIGAWPTGDRSTGEHQPPHLASETSAFDHGQSRCGGHAHFLPPIPKRGLPGGGPRG
jgi:hypothetical protein